MLIDAGATNRWARPSVELEVVGREGRLMMTESAMEILLLGATLCLTGSVWISRARFARRFNAALDAYAEREISRERSSNADPVTTSRRSARAAVELLR